MKSSSFRRVTKVWKKEQEKYAGKNGVIIESSHHHQLNHSIRTRPQKRPRIIFYNSHWNGLISPDMASDKVQKCDADKCLFPRCTTIIFNIKNEKGTSNSTRKIVASQSYIYSLHARLKALSHFATLDIPSTMSGIHLGDDKQSAYCMNCKQSSTRRIRAIELVNSVQASEKRGKPFQL